ncbi:GAF domain-containing sensor histidine kinase [Alkalihalobacillus pseudalcaliphilus]|uniref:GAF domain-containing sensor histidine kinase n=1 Tax=Alkalihalobacillus pseudalcaliphilus TaxID=79884 RepID=UPI00069D035A|nr:GAF domain-containing sensor histidine kinase [Alkalihalobacillus pseudalcaliphilus]
MTLNQGENLEDMLQAVLETLLETTGIESGWIFLIDEVGQHRLVAASGLPEGLKYQDCLPLKQGGCWCMNKYKNNELPHAVNIMNCKRLEQANLYNWGGTDNLERHATIPIRAGIEGLGIMNVASAHIDEFDETELELLETVAYQMGAAVKRFQLFLQEQERTMLLSKLGSYLALQTEWSNEQEFLVHTSETLMKLFHWSGLQVQAQESVYNFGQRNRQQRKIKVGFKDSDLQLVVFSDSFSQGSTMVLQEIATHLSLQLEKIEIERRKQNIVRTEERNRLARDLHDSVNQLLFSLILHAKGLEKRVKDEHINASIQSIHSLGTEALKELKQLIYQLRPEGLEFGLVAAIQKYGQLLGLVVHIEAKGLKGLTDEQELCLWRVIQEAMNNTKKHSGVTELFVTFQFSSECVQVLIKDHGVGFKPEKSTTGIGLKTMAERIKEVSGTVQVHSNAGNGTSIVIEVPTT